MPWGLPMRRVMRHHGLLCFHSERDSNLLGWRWWQCVHIPSHQFHRRTAQGRWEFLFWRDKRICILEYEHINQNIVWGSIEQIKETDSVIGRAHPRSETRDENKSNDFKGSPLRYFKPSSPISLLSKLRTSKLDMDAMCLKPRFQYDQITS